MGFLDRFRRRKGDDAAGKVHASSATVKELEHFLETRTGVEAFVEPPTAVYDMTVVLVAGDGEHIRRPVKSDKQAHQLCREHGVPVYDARIVGYPQRLHDYQQGTRRDPIGLDDLPPLETTDEEPPREGW